MFYRIPLTHLLVSFLFPLKFVFSISFSFLSHSLLVLVWSWPFFLLICFSGEYQREISKWKSLVVYFAFWEEHPRLTMAFLNFFPEWNLLLSYLPSFPPPTPNPNNGDCVNKDSEDFCLPSFFVPSEDFGLMWWEECCRLSQTVCKVCVMNFVLSAVLLLVMPYVSWVPSL